MNLSRTMKKTWILHFKKTDEKFEINRFNLYRFTMKNGEILESPVEEVDKKLIWLYDFKHYKYKQIRIRDVVLIELITMCEPFDHSSNRYKKRYGIL